MWERSKYVQIRSRYKSWRLSTPSLNINETYCVEKSMKDQNMFKLELYPHHTFEDVPTSFPKSLLHILDNNNNNDDGKSPKDQITLNPNHTHIEFI